MVTVVPYDPLWQSEFEAESKLIADALGQTDLAIHHIGSTSIPGIYAKPVIDILVEVSDIRRIDDRDPIMERLGYKAMGEFGIPGRRYFRKDNEQGIRTHQIHIFQTASPQITRHIAFRDFMIAHPEQARAYGELKRKLAAEHPYNVDAYMDGKDGFIKEIDRRASDWINQNR